MSSVVQQAEGEEGQQKQMKGPADLIEGYRRFRLSTYKRYVQSYRELGAHQEPNVMVCPNALALDRSQLNDPAI